MKENENLRIVPNLFSYQLLDKTPKHATYFSFFFSFWKSLIWINFFFAFLPPPPKKFFLGNFFYFWKFWMNKWNWMAWGDVNGFSCFIHSYSSIIIFCLSAFFFCSFFCMHLFILFFIHLYSFFLYFLYSSSFFCIHLNSFYSSLFCIYIYE